MPAAGIAVAFGTWVTAGVATGIAAGLIGGAIIGAAIGGITAAVTGGSIGKGMLFGAVGGAVLGGIGGWAAGASGGAGSAVGMTSATLEAEAGGALMGSTGTAVSAGTTATGGGILGGGAGLLSGQGTGAALVTTGGQMLMGAFSADPGDLTEKDKAQIEQADRLAQLQADTQLAIEKMRSGSGGSGGGSDHYAADIQLKNAREQRAQDYKVQHEEWSMIDEARARRAGAVTGVKMEEAPTVASTGPTAPGVMNRVAADPTPVSPTAALPGGGVMKEEVAVG